MNDCTIDVWVLKVIREGGDDYNACLLFMATFLYEEKCQVCVDTEGVVAGWYDKIAYRKTDLTDVLKRWWCTIQADLRVKPVRPRITKRMRCNLKKMVFHDDDYIWVGVANASTDKRIVSGDSDFGCNPDSPRKNRKDVRNYLEKHGIRPMRPKEALRLF